MFVAASDDATRDNFEVAKKIVVAGDFQLFAEDATREKLHAFVSANQGDFEIFSMTHGAQSCVFDNSGGIAICELDGTIFSQRKVFSWACYTGVTLGHAIVKQGGVWWGYDCAITAPDSRPAFLNVFANIFLVVKQVFPSGVEKNSIESALESIRMACEQALQNLDALHASEDVHACSIYSCCNQIWERLSVWVDNGSSLPFKHPLAPAPYIEI